MTERAIRRRRAAKGLKVFLGNVFLSYAHENVVLMKRLRTHFEGLKKQGLVEVWTDESIAAGESSTEEILWAIDTCCVAVLLISADFLASEYIQMVEMPRILERWQEGRLQIFPILVHECLWEEEPWLAELQLRPLNAAPLGKFRTHRREAELASIVREILSRLRSIRLGAMPQT
jgi:hypothetical protein